MISVVVPAYNEEENLPLLYQEVKKYLDGEDWELIIVNDGSSDTTEEVIKNLNKQDKRVKGISLSRNFGHQAAILAGLTYSSGDAIIIMDADMQYPPSTIPEFIKKWREGYEVVHGVAVYREDPLLKKLFAHWFYRFFYKVGIKTPHHSADFCLISKRVRDILILLPEKRKFLRALRTWSGFRQAIVYHERKARIKGEAKYTFLKSLSLAIDGILSFSFFPLRLVFFLGLFLTLFSLLIIIWGIIMYVAGRTVHGWTSLLVLLVFFSGVQLLSLSVIGEYIGRIYEEVKGRPPFLVDKTIGI